MVFVVLQCASYELVATTVLRRVQDFRTELFFDEASRSCLADHKALSSPFGIWNHRKWSGLKGPQIEELSWIRTKIVKPLDNGPVTMDVTLQHSAILPSCTLSHCTANIPKTINESFCRKLPHAMHHYIKTTSSTCWRWLIMTENVSFLVSLLNFSFFPLERTLNDCDPWIHDSPIYQGEAFSIRFLPKAWPLSATF